MSSQTESVGSNRGISVDECASRRRLRLRVRLSAVFLCAAVCLSAQIKTVCVCMTALQSP